VKFSWTLHDEPVLTEYKLSWDVPKYWSGIHVGGGGGGTCQNVGHGRNFVVMEAELFT